MTAKEAEEIFEQEIAPKVLGQFSGELATDHLKATIRAVVTAEAQKHSKAVGLPIRHIDVWFENDTINVDVRFEDGHSFVTRERFLAELHQ